LKETLRVQKKKPLRVNRKISNYGHPFGGGATKEGKKEVNLGRRIESPRKRGPFSWGKKTCGRGKKKQLWRAMKWERMLAKPKGGEKTQSERNKGPGREKNFRRTLYWIRLEVFLSKKKIRRGI